MVLVLALLAVIGVGCGQGSSSRPTPGPASPAPANPSPPGGGTTAGGAAATAAPFRVGAARVVITPVVEPYVDANGNQLFDPGESFTDVDGDGVFDPVWIGGINPRNAVLAAVPRSPWTLEAAPLHVRIQNPLLAGASFVGLFRNGGTLWTTPALSGEMGLMVAAALGPVRLITIPGEAFPEVGRAITAGFRAGTIPFAVGSANNHLGYLVPDSEFDLRAYLRGIVDVQGRTRYEVDTPGYHELSSLGPAVTSDVTVHAAGLITAVEARAP